MNLLVLARKLYRTCGRLNLYIALCGQEDELDIGRIRNEITQIKQVIEEIEEEMGASLPSIY